MLALSAAAAPAPTLAAASLPSGHFTLTAGAAAAVDLPQSLLDHQVSSWHDSKFNLDYTRYQQYSSGQPVDGAQVTVVSRAGQQLIVGGAFFPNMPTVHAPAISAAEALNVAADLRGGLVDLPSAIRALATRSINLRVDPDTGRLFFLIATAALGNNGYQEIDAQTGALLDAWGGVDQVSAGQGVGVKGDTKTLKPDPFADMPDLTSGAAGNFKLQSLGGTFVTNNAAGGNSIGALMIDSDNIWDTNTEAAGVDAQYYAALTVQFYLDEFGWDWTHDCNTHAGYAPGFPGTVRSVVHYDASPNSTPYDNAFWDEQQYFMVYGDGSTTDLPLSAGQDVVSHELSHGVTQCRENLAYQKESGALNESFSDIMATAAEFSMEEPLSSNCRLAPGQTECGDWLIGEDLARTASGAAIRNLADPESEGQPSNYQDRASQGSCSPSQGNDFCSVHTNSGIPNHAFYLMANGGRNARCSGPNDPQADCDVLVPPTSLDHTMHMFFSAFGILSSAATMCDARNAVVAHASVLYPNSVTDTAAALLGWQAVGLGHQCNDSVDFTVNLSNPTVELAAGQAGSTQLSLVRQSGNSNDTINYSVDTDGPATGQANPASNPGGDSSGAQINVTADNSAADGVYPVLVTATGDTTTQYAAATIVVDSLPPSAAVNGVGFVAQSTVITDGSIPLSVTWSVSDGQSGIGSAELDHSPNGSGWVAIYGPGAPSSPTQYSATAGPHQFQAIATDEVGNTTTSAAFIRTLTAFQETQATYTGTWSTNTTANPWGTTKYSTRRRATATLTFTGNAVVWIAQRGPKRGVANVFVDGVKTHVDLYSISLSERRVVFIASNLSAGQHTIKIKVKATSGRPRVDVDGFFVLG